MAERPSPRGTYLSIADNLRKDVEGGRFTSSLPSEATLMASHGVSRNTVCRALKVLEAGRVIESVPGVGWRVLGSGGATSLVDRMVSVILDDHLAVGDVYPSESQPCTRFGALTNCSTSRARADGRERSARYGPWQRADCARSPRFDRAAVAWRPWRLLSGRTRSPNRCCPSRCRVAGHTPSASRSGLGL
jgi:hypothetical protein